MSKKHFSWLLVITAVVAVLVMLIPGQTSKESLFENQLLLPDLASAVNDIDEVTVITAGPETAVTLRRTDGLWVVQEAFGYPANWEALRNLLRDLAQARIVENKTSNPEFYSRLGVEDLAQADAKGVKVVLGRSGEIPPVIVGNSAQGREGQYLRLDGVGQSVLIGSQLQVPRDIQAWLIREIIDVASSEVVEFKIVHPDGEVVSASKISADDSDFDLHAIPEGREISSAWSVNQVGGALAALQLDGVRKASDIDWTDAVQFSVLTADGMAVEAQLVALGDDRWIKLVASSRVEDDKPADSADSAESEDSTAATDAAETEDSVLTEKIDSINQRTGGWAYRIPAYKYDALVKRMDSMLKALDEA